MRSAARIEAFLEMMSAERGASDNTLQSYRRDLEDAATVLGSATIQLDVNLIERELQSLAGDIGDHDIPERWQRTEKLRTRLS